MLGDAQAALKDAEAALEEDKEFNKVFVFFKHVFFIMFTFSFCNVFESITFLHLVH